jgi:hypothetical protein
MGYNPGYVDGNKVANNAAYTPGLGLWKVLDAVGSAPAFWIYVTTDSLAAVQASGYVSDATFKRLKLGDIVDVFSGPLVSQAVNNANGAALGAVTFPATLGVLSLFSGTPQYQRMIVSALTAGTTTTSGTATLSAAEPTVNAFAGLPRNMVDCGDFTTNPWQIATTFNGSSATPTLTADRWNANSGGSLVWTAGRTLNTNVNGFTAAYVWGRSAGDSHTTGLSVGQVIETLDAIRCQGLPVSLSFYAQPDANFAAGLSGGTYQATILAGTGVNESSGKMFSAAWSGVSTVATQAITPGAAGTAVRIGPIAGTVPTNATELGVIFSYVATGTAGTHESIELMGVQLEIGSMTPFEHTEVAEVINIATRYLQVINEPTVGMAIGPAVFSASSIAQVHIPFASPMRAAPTLTFTAGGFAITDSALGAHTISAAGLQVANTGAATLLVTAAATLTAGLVSFMQGRTTNSGILIFNADF